MKRSVLSILFLAVTTALATAIILLITSPSRGLPGIQENYPAGGISGSGNDGVSLGGTAGGPGRTGSGTGAKDQSGWEWWRPSQLTGNQPYDGVPEFQKAPDLFPYAAGSGGGDSSGSGSTSYKVPTGSALSLDDVAEMQERLEKGMTLKDRLTAARILFVRLSSGDRSRLLALGRGELTPEKQAEALDILGEKLTPEEMLLSISLAYKYKDLIKPLLGMK